MFGIKRTNPTPLLLQHYKIKQFYEFLVLKLFEMKAFYRIHNLKEYINNLKRKSLIIIFIRYYLVLTKCLELCKFVIGISK